MEEKTRYEQESKTVMFQGRPVTLTHRTPVLPPEQQEMRKQAVELVLFDIFKKYYDSNGK